MNSGRYILRSMFRAISIAALCWAVWLSCSKDKKTNPLQPPTAPSNLSGVAFSFKSISLNWQDNSDNEDNFLLFRQGTVSWHLIDLLPANRISYVDSSLQDTSAYSYYIIAKNKAGNSPTSDTVSLMTKSKGEAPYMPSEPTPPNNSDDISIATSLTWQCGDPDADTLKYDLYFGLAQPPPRKDSNLIANIYDPGLLSYNSTYFWKVVAMDNYRHISSGPIWTFTTASNRPPIQPSSPSPAIGDTIHDTITILGWESSDPENDSLKYDVYFGNDSLAPLIASDLDSNSLQVGNLVRGQTYFWKIIARDSYDNTSESPIWNFHILGSGLYLLGNYRIQGYVWDVSIMDNYAYVAADDSGLYVIDVSNPSNPVLTGICPPQDRAHGVVVSGEYAYVSDCFSGLQIINIFDPFNPFMVSSFDTPGDAFDGLYYSNGLLYLPDMWGGMSIINVNDPNNPTLAGSYTSTGGLSRDVFVLDSCAYLIYEDADLIVLNVSNPAAPSRIGFFTYSGDAFSVCGLLDRLFIPSDGAGLIILDISNPRWPRLLGTYNYAGRPFGVCLSGDHVYIADGNGSLKVVNVSDPSHPVLASQYDLSGFAFSVKVSQNYVYVVTNNGGLFIFEFLP